MPLYPKITLLMLSYPILNNFIETLKETAGVKDISAGTEEECARFDPQTVVLDQGILRGTCFCNGSSSKYRAFMGIPYAKPPVGELRFQPPQPVENRCCEQWATKLGNNAVQQCNSLFQTYTGDEDCLYLNVYTPLVTEENKDTKYPVMFWIHGGAFNTGSGDWEYYGPDYLVKQDVIVVTINYRLGVFGFLCAPEWGIYGNMGLKDQREALRWVNKNIEKFGGDKENVTIFGESAGAASVHYLMMDKSTNDLYQKAILQSGTALNPWAIQFEPQKNLEKLQESLKTCSKEDLLNIDSKTLLSASLSDVPDREDIRRAAEPVFKPVIEEKCEANPDPIITESVLKLMQEEGLPEKDVIIGFNNMEGLFALTRVDADCHEVEKTLRDPERVIPRDAFIWENPLGQDQAKIVKELCETYVEHFYNDDDPDDRLGAYIHLMGDAWFLNGIYRTLKHGFDYKRKSKLYLYMLSDDSYSIHKKYALKNWNHLRGVAHTDDLGYLFKMSPILYLFSWPLNIPTDETAQRTHNRMVVMWTNFAKTGNPMKSELVQRYRIIDALAGYTWDPCDSLDPKYLEIGKRDFGMRHFSEIYRMCIWDRIFETGIKNSSMKSANKQVAEKAIEKYSKMLHIPSKSKM